MYSQRVLGKTPESPAVSGFTDLSYKFEANDRGSVSFRHDDDTVYSVEEVVAMILQHAHKAAEADTKADVSDCVIAVSSYWAQKKRQALLDAAEIAS